MKVLRFFLIRLAEALRRRKPHTTSLTPALSANELATRQYLLFVILPLWVASGFLDWIWHRRTRIERTAGLKESVIHALMMGEAGVAVMAGLVLEINAGVLVLMLSALGVHWATAFWDVRYAETKRDVRPNEQHIHSMLEVLPLCAVSLVVVLHWEQTLALLRIGRKPADFAVGWKKQPLSLSYIAFLLSALTAGIAIPYGEELVRCWRAKEAGLEGSEIPAYVRLRVADGDNIASIT